MVEIDKIKILINDIKSIPTANDNYPAAFLDDLFWEHDLP